MGRAKGKLSKGQPRGARSASGRKRERAVERLGPCEGIIRRREMYRTPSGWIAPTAGGFIIGCRLPMRSGLGFM